MSGALAARAAQEEGSRGRVEATKVRRYWPGKRPDWVEEEEELAVLGSRAPASHSKKQDAAQHTGIAAPVIVSRADARLRRLHRSQEAGTADDEEARPRRSHQREIIEPQIVRRAREPETDHRSRRDDDEIREKKEDDEEAESDEEATALRRRMLRERIQREENEAATALRSAGPSIGGTEVPPRGYVHPEEEGEEEESSEYETEDEDEEVAQVLLKPVFVPKTDRETIRERELLEQREEARAEGEEARLQARKEETREMVAARLEAEAAEEEAAARAPRGMDDVDTDDEQDEEAAYDAWRLRELSRIARDLAEREQEAAEAAERARWQALSEEEREREIAARRAAILEVDKPKKKWRFLQKYWHRGAFFQDAGDAQAEGASIAGDMTQRDFSAPTGEDLFDRASLPKIMQKRNFGLRGQTKWTHLVDQDTTSWDALWMQKEGVHGKLTKKLAGTEQVFTRPRNTNT